MIGRFLALARYSLYSGSALLLGFARELVVSSHFGLSKELDVYLAMGGFFLFFGTQVGNALEMVFVSKAAELDNAAKITQRLMHGLKVLLLVNLVAVGVLLGASDDLVGWIFPGFSEEQRELGVLFLAYLSLAIVFANVSGLIRASLNVMRRFGAGMTAGSIVSVCGITAVYGYGDAYGVKALLYGFIVGHSLVFAVSALIFLRRADFSYRRWPREARPFSPGLWQSAAIVLMGEVFYQAFAMTERGFASTFETGTVSAFFYAWTLVTIPLSLVVMPLSTVLYPRLAEAFGADRKAGYAMLKRYGGVLFLGGLLAVAAISLVSGEVVKLVFLRGKFSLEDADKTARILSVVIFALPFMSVVRLVRYALYSISNYMGPSIALLVGWLVMAVAATLTVPVYGMEGLAYSSMAAFCTESLAMIVLLRLSLKHESRQVVAEAV
jgi:putative peptidoglycan lipid II flippase